MTLWDWIALGTWSVVVGAVAWTIGNAAGYARGVKWSSDFEKRVRQ